MFIPSGVVFAEWLVSEIVRQTDQRPRQADRVSRGFQQIFLRHSGALQINLTQFNDTCPDSVLSMPCLRFSRKDASYAFVKRIVEPSSEILSVPGRGHRPAYRRERTH